MKFKKMFIIMIMAFVFTSCESGFEDMMDETQSEKVYKYYAYVANYNSKSVSAYSINVETGELTSINTYTTLFYAMHLTTDPSNKFLYVACTAAVPTPTAGYVYAYSINSSTGALTEINHYSTGASSQSVKVDPEGKYLYVANGGSSWPEDKTVHVYTINQDGSLTLKTTITTGTGSGTGIGSGAGPCSIAINPVNKFLYILESYGLDIKAYTIGDGTYGSIGTYSASPGPNGSNYPRTMVVDSNGKYFYSVHQGAGGIYAYAINGTTGALENLVTYPGAANLNGITINPRGNFAYVTASGGGSGSILLYSVNAGTGILSFISQTNVSYNGSTSPKVDPSGKFLYITNWNDANVAVYLINATTGGLTEISGSPFGTGSTPYSIITIRI